MASGGKTSGRERQFELSAPWHSLGPAGGDIVSLVERAEEKMDQEAAERLEAKDAVVGNIAGEEGALDLAEVARHVAHRDRSAIRSCCYSA